MRRWQTFSHRQPLKTARATRTLFAVILVTNAQMPQCGGVDLATRDLYCLHHSPEPRKPCYSILTLRTFNPRDNNIPPQYSFICIHNQANINSTGIYYNLWTCPAAGGKVFVSFVILQATLKKETKKYQGTIFHEEKMWADQGCLRRSCPWTNRGPEIPEYPFDRGCNMAPRNTFHEKNSRRKYYMDGLNGHWYVCNVLNYYITSAFSRK